MMKYNSIAITVALLCFGIFLGPTFAQAQNKQQANETVVVRDFSNETAEEKAERMKWFTDARFGMFIHWGLYAQPGGEWKGKKVPGIGEWIQQRAAIPVAEYEPLQKSFNPNNYDADVWVRLAKQAGMKYIVITSKHHDGFCLFDSEFTDWDVTETPYRQDLLKPLAEACRQHGLKMCFYYSIMDWHHPEYGNKAPWRGNANNDQPDMEVYRTYMKNQLRELLTDYGDIGILWFDGEWENAWTHEMGIDLYDYCRSIKPNVIVNNRVDKGRNGMAGMSKGNEFRGDYGTPEQEIPHRGFGKGVYWESCMTMNNTWGFKTDDHHWKSNRLLIRNLIDIASKGGNFLLNVGPTATGEIPQPSVERLQAIGNWMDQYGESIYGTAAGPFERLSFDGRCTEKRTTDGTMLYLHVFAWPENGELKIRGLSGSVTSVQLLGSNQEVLVSQGATALTLSGLPKSAPNEIASVIQVNFAGEATVEPWSIEATSDGAYVLSAADAELDGPEIRLQNADSDSGANIGFWTDETASVKWNVFSKASDAAQFDVVIEFACETASADAEISVAVGESEAGSMFTVPSTGGWGKYQTTTIGNISLPPGKSSISVKAQNKPNEAVMNLRSIKLMPSS